ncbi:nuclear transport factor 2 family protein [Streptomyces sp. NPDC002306]
MSNQQSRKAEREHEPAHDHDHKHDHDHDHELELEQRRVLQAADDLVAAFGEERLSDYFQAFAPDATFVFHTTERRVESVAEYRRLWARWVADDDLRVLKCLSTDRKVQLWHDTAVFTHTVETDIATLAGTQTLQERETIVFRREADGRWTAVHEHLSPAVAFPSDDPARPSPIPG